MLAEPAAATGEIVEGQEADPTPQTTPAVEETTPAASKVLSEPIGDRLQSILGGMDLPEGIVEQELEEKPGTVATPPGEGEEEPAPPAKVEGTEEELTEEQKDQWAPEALARIHKVTAQREDARKQAKTEQEARVRLEEENAALKQQRSATPAIAPTANDPLSYVQTPEQLTAVEAELERWLDWTAAHPSGGLDVEVGKDHEGKPILQDFSPEDTSKLRNDISRTLRKAVPARKEFLDERAQHEQSARNYFAEMFQKGTSDYVLANAIREKVPFLETLVGGSLNIGIFMKGLKSLELELAEKNGKLPKNPSVAAFTRPQPRRAPSLPKVQRPSTETDHSDQGEVESAEKEAVETAGSPEAMLKLVSQLRSAQHTRRAGHRLTGAR